VIHAFRGRRLALFAVMAVIVAVVPAIGRGEQTAAGVARLGEAERQIEARFVARVAQAVGLQESEIRALLPQEARIADQGRRLVQAIGKHHRRLGPSEEAAVLEADRVRREELARSRR